MAEESGESTLKEVLGAGVPMHTATLPGDILDWDNPDNLENPHNWSPVKKYYHVLAIGFLCFAVTAGTSLISPSLSQVAVQFQVSQTAAMLPLSLFVVGLAVGPMIAAPISEYMGRNGVIKLLPPIYMLFVMGGGFCKTFGGLLVCRLLAGAAGSPPLAVGAGTVADLYIPHRRVVPLSIYITAPFLGSGCGPIIGGAVAYYKDYRWTQWVTIFIAIVAYVLVLPMQETYKKTLIERHAKRRIKPESKVTITPPTNSTLLQQARRLLAITLFRPIQMLFLEPIVFFLTLYNAFTFGVLFAFFAAYPYVFESVYNFNTWQTGLTFLAIAAGYVLAGLTAVTVDRKMYRPRYLQALAAGDSSVRPEHRLYAAMIGSFGVTVGLFWFAWSSRRSIHWISSVLSGLPFAWGSLTVFISASSYILDTYGPLYGASAIAANGLGRYFMSAAFPLFTIQMYKKLGIEWATTLLACLSLLVLPIPWIFYACGPGLRKRSLFRGSEAQRHA